jgi:integrase/recombinase XerD
VAAGSARGRGRGLRLGDIDWSAGQITVTGKGRKDTQLPLPADVGEVIAVRLRPGTGPDRAVFVRLHAPYRGLTVSALTNAVAVVSQRAGLGVLHAHRLRHSAATAMLAGGASLAEIGQVLAHQNPVTTSIYARVDIEALRSLARDGGSVMDLDAMLGDYLQVRRELGVKLTREEKLLRQFLAWLAERDMTAITADAALA